MVLSILGMLVCMMLRFDSGVVVVLVILFWLELV